MADLFEAFVRNFLHRELDGVAVGREVVHWADAVGTHAALSWLPRMHTDVTVSTAERRTIIETKYYREPFASRFDVDKVRSAHLYQLFAYLRNAKPRVPGQLIDGVLLYAQVGRSVCETFCLGETNVALRTIDLTAPWPDIRRQLLQLPVPTIS
jgi:5-methylcytosine-specific restriction enzyme subunit McrC